MRRSLTAAACALVASALLASLALAAWVPGGTRVSPLPPQYDSYFLTGAAADGNGGATIAWMHETRVDGADPPYYYYRVEAQHLGRDGVVLPGWPAAGRQLAAWNPMGGTALNSAYAIGVLPDEVGGAYVVTQESALIGDYIDYAQAYRLAPSGAVATLGGTPYGLLNATAAAVDVDGASGLVFVAQPRGHAPPPEPVPLLPLVAQRFDSLGTALWPAVALAPPGQAQAEAGLAIASDGAGGAFTAWVDRRDVATGTVDPDLYVQHVRSDGSLDPAWPADGVLVCGAPGLQSRPALRADGTGGVYVTWYDGRLPAIALYASNVRGDGAVASGVPADGRLIGSAESTADRFDLRADGLGGLYVLQATRGYPLVRRVVLHRLGTDGLPLPGWPLGGRVLDADPADAYVSNGGLAVDDTHGVFAAYPIPRGNPARDVLVNEFDANGQPAPGWVAQGQGLAPSGAPYGMITVTRSDAGAIVAWSDGRELAGVSGTTVYAQRVLPDGPVATAVTLVSAEASAGGVRVRWSVALDGASALAVERRAESGDWAVLAHPLPDGDGRVEFMDAAVEPGARYAYRLTWSERGIAGASAPVWVSVPVTGALSLRVGPNPAERASEVRFTLPRAGAASVSVLDVSGRRVRMLARGSFAAGEHVRPWDLRDDAGRAVGAGLYLVRFESEAGVLVTKATVTR